MRDGGAMPLKTNVDVFLANRPPENNQYWMDAYKYSKMLPFTTAWSEMNRLYNEEMNPVWQNTRVPRINEALAGLPR